MSATEQAANNAPVIEIDGLNKWYGAFHVLRDINLSVDQASGSLSVALRAVANRP